MPIFTPYYWSYRKDIYGAFGQSTVYIPSDSLYDRPTGRYISGAYLESLSYYTGQYLTITGNEAPAYYYFDSQVQRNNIRLASSRPTSILFGSSTYGETFKLFPEDINISFVYLDKGANTNIDVSLAIGNITLTGNIGSNILTGNSGDNVFDGKGGGDTLIGGSGNDTYYVYSDGDKVIEKPNEGVDSIILKLKYGINSYTIADNVENLTSLSVISPDKIIGNSSDNVIESKYTTIIDGGAGADTLIGSASIQNIYYVDNVNDVIIEKFESPYTKNIVALPDEVRSSVNWTLGDYLENLTLLGSSNLNGTGNSLTNKIVGNSGNNIIDGKVGADLMIGGAGNDTYYVDNYGDEIREWSGEGNDTVISDISFTINRIDRFEIENITLTETSTYRNTNAYGNYKSNILIGNSGNNILDGGAYWGDPSKFNTLITSYTYGDTLIGGKGDDVYLVENDNDTIVELANEGTDTVYANDSFTLSANVENLILRSSYNINAQYYATGNDGDNNITGNDGDNVIQGKGGNDTIIGGGGCDVITGGTGSDTFSYSAGDAIIGKKNVLKIENGKYYYLPKFERITDLEIGVDLIDAPGATVRTPTNVGELVLPNNYFDYDNMISALNTKFIQNQAIVFTYNQRTYLGIDDGKAGFNNTTDSVIDITGYTGNLSDLRII